MKTVREHAKKQETKKRMEIEVVLEFHELFKSSETMSSNFPCHFNPLEEHGRFSSLLMNFSKRRYFEIEEEKVLKDQDLLKKLSTQKNQTIEGLKGIITKFKTERLGFIKDQDRLSKLFHTGQFFMEFPFHSDRDDENMK